MKIDTPSHTPMFGQPVSPWHWWFAWYPIVTWDGRPVWCVPVMRRLIQKHAHLSGPNFNWFEYHFKWGYVKPKKEDNNEQNRTHV